MTAAFSDDYLAVPIAGPIIFASQVGGFGGNPIGAGATTLLILDSGLQLTGVALTIVGAVTHHRSWNPPVAFAQVVGRDCAGAALAFRF
jgi:hypothetical protein